MDSRATPISSTVVIRLRSEGDRAVVFENVIVRAGNGHDMEVHIDTDEANAVAMSGSVMMEVLK